MKKAVHLNRNLSVKNLTPRRQGAKTPGSPWAFDVGCSMLDVFLAPSRLSAFALKISIAFLPLSAVTLFAAVSTKPVSYYKDIVPVFKRSCTGCHHPGKLKGELDLTTYAGFLKGGKHGPGFKAGSLTNSLVVEEISGSEPTMPKEGDPLGKAEIAMIERWIMQGARDDTPAGANSFKRAAPPTYLKPPVTSALAFSPDGSLLAVSGYHEVLLRSADGSNLVGRLVGESPASSSSPSRPTASSSPSPAARPRSSAKFKSGTSPPANKSLPTKSPTTPSTAWPFRPTANASPSVARTRAPVSSP